MRKLVFALIVLFSTINSYSQELINGFVETNGTIKTTLQVNNRLFIGGDFSYVGKTTGPFGVFSTQVSDSSGAPISISGNVFSMAKDNSGRIYLGGDFSLNGVRTFLACLNPDYSLNTSFSVSLNGVVSKVLVSGNTLAIAGEFTTVNNQQRISLATISLESFSLNSFAPIPDGKVNDLAFYGTDLLVGGIFSSISGQARASLAMVGSDGSIKPFNFPVNGTLNAMLVSDSLLFLGGKFDSVSGVFRGNLASINLQSSELRLWAPKTDGEVFALEFAEGNVYAGGSFFSINGTQSRTSIACLNQFTGLPTSFEIGFDGPVKRISKNENLLYFAGDFSFAGSQERNFFAVSAFNGSIQNSVRVNGSVNAILFVGKQGILAGSFSSLGGVSKRYFATLDKNSGQIISYPIAPDGVVKGISLVGSNLLLNGDFMSIGNDFRPGIALVDTINGSADSWNPQLAGNVNSAIPFGNLVLIGGSFSSIGDSVRANLAMVSLQSGLAESWNPTINGPVDEVVMLGGQVIIRGDFSEVNSVTRKWFASFSLGSGLSLSNLNPAFDSSLTDFDIAGNLVLATGNFKNLGSNEVASSLCLIDPATGSITTIPANYIGYPKAVRSSGQILFLGGEISSNLSNGLLAFNKENGVELPLNSGIQSGSVSYLGGNTDQLFVSGTFTHESGKRNFTVYALNSPTPANQTAGIQITSVSPISARVSIQMGSGAKRLVMIKMGTAVDTIPQNGIVYSASKQFSRGSNLGGNFVINASSDTAFDITGLQANSTYHLASFEYNGLGIFSNYLTQNPARANFTTTDAFQVPTISASNVQVSKITLNSARVKWTRGNGTSCLVLAKEAAAVNAVPADSTPYFQNINFGNGSQIGSGNFVVYDGPADSVVLNNLSEGTSYHLAVFEYNGIPTLARIKATNPGIGNFTSLQRASLPQTPASNLTVVSSGNDEIQLSWASGSGSSRIVIAAELDSVRTMPKTGEIYFSDNYFNGISSFLSPNERVVYVGTGNSVSVKGLNQLTKYGFAVIEYNGTELTSNYLTSTFPSIVASTMSFISGPKIPASAVVQNYSTTDSLGFRWIKGDGDSRLVLMRKGSAVTALPELGVSYVASAKFGSGDMFSDSSYVVGDGNLDSILVTGLESNQTYHIAIFEYNVSQGSAIYLTSSFAIGSGKTQIPVGIKKFKKGGFKLYPNPVNKGKVYFSLPEELKENFRVAVYDLNGSELLIFESDFFINNKVGDTIELPVDGLKAGSYIIKLSSGDSLITQSILVE